jgi:hypothetical protein
MNIIVENQKTHLTLVYYWDLTLTGPDLLGKQINVKIS